jgi:hypothetical protein
LSILLDLALFSQQDKRGSTDSRPFIRQAGGCIFNLPHVPDLVYGDFRVGSDSAFAGARGRPGNKLGFE